MPSCSILHWQHRMQIGRHFFKNMVAGNLFDLHRKRAVMSPILDSKDKQPALQGVYKLTKAGNLSFDDSKINRNVRKMDPTYQEYCRVTINLSKVEIATM